MATTILQRCLQYNPVVAILVLRMHCNFVTSRKVWIIWPVTYCLFNSPATFTTFTQSGTVTLRCPSLLGLQSFAGNHAILSATEVFIFWPASHSFFLTASRHSDEHLLRIFRWIDRKQQILIRVFPSIVIHFDDANLQHLWIGFVTGDKVVECNTAVVDFTN